MIQVQLKDGKVFMAEDATWTIQPTGDDGQMYGLADVKTIGLADIQYDVTHGTFGPAKMPIRGLRFTDPSGIRVEVPLPLPVAIEMGEMLMTTKVEVVRNMPSALLFGPRPRPRPGGTNGR